jgi:hypothetical protein
LAIIDVQRRDGEQKSSEPGNVGAPQSTAEPVRDDDRRDPAQHRQTAQ